MNSLEQKRALLKQKVRELLPEPGVLQTGIKGFSATLRTAPTFNQHCFYKPMAIVVLQGEKQAVLGTEKFTYGENKLIVSSISIPTVGSITKASAGTPFMTLILELDHYIIGRLLSEGESEYSCLKSACLGMGIADADEALLDAFYRLISLVEHPERQKVMAPLILRELHYLLLISPLGGIIHSVNVKGPQNSQIAAAIAWLKRNFRRPLKIETLAEKFGMAESSFYRHFSKVTSLSPLQYQKQLRLYEAQRLMLAENFLAEEAAYKVGYESVTQFNREYKRMFGAPPKTNVNRVKLFD